MRQSVALLILMLMIVVSVAKKAITNIKTSQISEETIQVSPEITQIFEETARVSPEITQISEETAQIFEETTQVSPEITQISEETARVSPEITQISEETARVSPEITQISGNTIQISPKITQIFEESASLCRLVNDKQGLIVQKRPTPNSPTVGSVDPNQQVTLIEGYRNIRGPAGRTWVEITSPISGFVSRGFPGNENNLIECSEVAEESSGEVSSQEETPAESSSQNAPIDNLPTQTSPTSESASEIDESLCREIDSRKAPRGLAVRADATRRSEYRGKVPVNGQLTLVENYRLIPDKNGEKRKWVKISSPLRGFVSAGNLVECE
ncbi:MAG: hypothetical protein F6K22_32880 [Okeania sp. SIO2F4]|uniref:methyl-accepting chemotaxis protein n=1 Tax=Okeania sp. SIO2F4 TaxID=2607790 RepID=UPI001429B113|nr:methyl-accepting chemotaxis protein [Okeania sp. SIO2F4]NES07174.1 hypothetical protein [Okeania sp. SIO2F4]